MDENNKTISPLYEDVKRSIFLNFQSLKRQNSLVQTSMNKTEKKFALINFKERFSNFYFDICTENKINKIKEENKKILTYYSKHLDKINSRKKASKITEISRILIDKLGITNIEIEDVKSLGYKK